MLLDFKHTEPAPSQVIEVQKSQQMRLVDVFFVGPVLIYYGTQMRDPMGQLIVSAIGAATILYNGGNYLQNKRKGEA